jgi:hypothetical protein
MDIATGGADHLLHRRAGNREEPDQMLRRGKHGDVLDALVVGLTGAVSGGTLRSGGPSILISSNSGFGSHEKLPHRIETNTNTHKKTAGVAGGFEESGRLDQLRSELSTAGGV